MALHENGVDPEKRSIVGADGAIPYIENIPDEGLDRFRSQFEMVDLIDVEDAASIGAKVKECIEKDPGAIEEEAMVIVIEEEGEEEEGEEVRPVAPETALNRSQNACYPDANQGCWFNPETIRRNVCWKGTGNCCRFSLHLDSWNYTIAKIGGFK